MTRAELERERRRLEREDPLARRAETQAVLEMLRRERARWQRLDDMALLRRDDPSVERVVVSEWTRGA